MRIWFLGQEVDSFKPLRHTLKNEVIKQLYPSDKLKREGWTAEKLHEFISFKCFVDPKYKGCLRTSTQIVVLNGFTVEDIIAIIQYSEQESTTEHVVFYVDFAKDKQLLLCPDLIKHSGINVQWIEEDLKAEGNFIEKNDNMYIFETKHFKYFITDKVELCSILHKQSSLPIANIQWSFESCLIKTKNGDTFVINDDYVRWLSHLVTSRQYYWPKPHKDTKKIGSLVEAVKDRWVIHPKVWKIFSNMNLDKNFLIDLWQNDWKRNGMYLVHKQAYCEIVGWRFLYIWDGLVLIDIQTPEGKSIDEIEIKNNFLILNGQSFTSLEKEQPEFITELVVGNLISILPKSLIMSLELHEHAILRYEQRVNDHAYLCVMFNHILSDIYYNGRVNEGAHTSDRRKVVTHKYGYVISNRYVISVWTKNNQPQLKTKKPQKQQSKHLKPSKALKHLEKMSKLFDEIK